MNRNFFGIGLMSGTSMDGVDVSIIKSDGERYLELVDDMYIKYDDIVFDNISLLPQIINRDKIKGYGQLIWRNKKSINSPEQGKIVKEGKMTAELKNTY